MKGISFLKDQKNKKRFVKIDLKKLPKTNNEWEDLIDAIIAESRRDEPSIPFEKVVNKLRKAGRI